VAAASCSSNYSWKSIILKRLFWTRQEWYRP